MSQTLNVACPACHAVNRVIPEKYAQARCGKCQAALASAQPLELTAASFAAHAEKSELPVLVDFWAPWCGPCKMMAPAFAEAAGQLAPAVRLAKVNTEAEQALAARFQIRSIPTMILFQHGRELGRMSGALPAGQIVAFARQHLR